MTDWVKGEAPLCLDRNMVAIWQVALEAEQALLQRLFALLDPSEQQRAKRFYRPCDQQHFTVARGVLRCLLGAYTGQPPETLKFAYLLHGKPVLQEHTVQFNVSHSHGQALYAFATQARLGVDLEYEDRAVEWPALSERFFARAEHQAILGCSPEDQKAAFFRCWTRKEAYVKAHGDGLLRGLQQFEVSVGEQAKLLADHDAPEQCQSWQMQGLHLPGLAFQAALVYESGAEQPLQLQYHTATAAWLFGLGRV